MPLTESIIEGTLGSVIDDAVIQIVQEINTVQIQVDKYIAAQNGQLSVQGLRDAIFGGQSSVISNELSSFQRFVLRTALGATNDAWGKGTTVRQAEDEQRTRTQKQYVWRVESAKPCPDCSGRNGETRTLAEWQAAGLPRSGFSVCGRNCKCIIDSSGSGNFNRPNSKGE